MNSDKQQEDLDLPYLTPNQQLQEQTGSVVLVDSQAQTQAQAQSQQQQPTSLVSSQSQGSLTNQQLSGSLMGAKQQI